MNTQNEDNSCGAALEIKKRNPMATGEGHLFGCCQQFCPNYLNFMK
jgi:hypothetical protein